MELLVIDYPGSVIWGGFFFGSMSPEFFLMLTSK